MTRILILALVISSLGGIATAATRPAADGSTPAALLPAVTAAGVHLDTLLLGGYSAGGFTDAVHRIAIELTPEERILVGQHLERIFAELLPGAGLGQAGRLRVAYERARRPDGSTRSIRVLGAEVAVAGRIHTAFYFELDGRPGYFDPFGRPLDGATWQGPLQSIRVTSGFADRRLHPILNRVLPHTGVDLAARLGEPVRAPADGIVASAGPRGGYGLLVELQHPNGYSTRYAHLSSLPPGIERTRAVRRGEVIGFAGMSGLATGPHLHYEVRRRGQPLDPMRIVSDGPFTSGIEADPRWTEERNHLGSLLARAPTVTQARRSDPQAAF